MAYVDSSLDGSMTVIVLDKDESDALSEALAALDVRDALSPILAELVQAL